MENADKNYLRQWREFRKMSQDDLAEKAETTKSVISLLENEKRPLSSKWLRRFAVILETQPGHILDVDPNEIDNNIIDIWATLSKTDRQQAAKILRTFKATGTDS
jgi:transcriptional regulator with XRE-family HTH domain